MAKFDFHLFRRTSTTEEEKGSTAHLFLCYANARRNLLSVPIFTTISVILLLTNSSSIHFLFGASIPFWLPAIATRIDNLLMIGHPFTIAAYAISMVSIFLYVLCWLFSHDWRGWMIAALVLFSLDSLFMIGMMYTFHAYWRMILEFLYHVWIMCYLIRGVYSSGKLLKAFREARKAQASASYPASQ